MSRAHSFPLFAALIATSLTLGACGSDDDSGASDKIKGAKEASKSPTAPTTADSENRPPIKTPGFQLKFENWTSGNPTKQAILNDSKERLRSLHAGIIEGKSRTTAMTYYSSGSALLTGQEWVDGFINKNLTLTGHSRYYDAHVKYTTGDSASIEFCNDQSHGVSKNRKTGKATGSSSGSDSYVLYRNNLERDAKGVWKTTAAVTVKGKCQP